MTNKQRDDMMISLLMICSSCGDWAEEELFHAKAKSKLLMVRKAIEELTSCYGKTYGEKALWNLLDMCNASECTVQPKNGKADIVGSYDGECAKGLLKLVADEYGGECDICTCKDHTKCVMFAVKNLINGAEYSKGECPYKLGEAWE